LTPTTEIIVAGGERHRVQGDAKQIEALIIDAARGSMMEFAWMIDAESGEDLALNPEQIVMIRALAS
jgi:hypothetical protein